MAEQDQPQIYLITPPEFELSTYPDMLARTLDAAPVAAVRLSLASRDEDRVARAADALRAVCHERDVPLIIAEHVQLVERLGLDGVHLEDGARSVRATRKALGGDAVVGAFCGTSKHDGMNAGEAGADYIAFGPVGVSSLGDGSLADFEMFEWWSQMIELPVIAEGGLSDAVVARLAPVTDFFGIGPEIWSDETPEKALVRLIAAMT
ncbi:MAG TPA: thiamine phosphate synthase [Aliiroseovarius sp.]|nr:thiamine phosphate synthase [Aliiroseovarius sp.]